MTGEVAGRGSTPPNHSRSRIGRGAVWVLALAPLAVHIAATKSYGPGSVLLAAGAALAWSWVLGGRLDPFDRSIPGGARAVVAVLAAWSAGALMSPGAFAAGTPAPVGPSVLLAGALVAGVLGALAGAWLPRATMSSVLLMWSAHAVPVGLVVVGSLSTQSVLLWGTALLVATATCPPVQALLGRPGRSARVLLVWAMVAIPMMLHLDRSLYLGLRATPLMVLGVHAALVLAVLLGRLWPLPPLAIAAAFGLSTQRYGGQLIAVLLLGAGVMWSIAADLLVPSGRFAPARRALWPTAAPLLVGAASLSLGLGLVPEAAAIAVAAAMVPVLVLVVPLHDPLAAIWLGGATLLDRVGAVSRSASRVAWSRMLRVGRGVGRSVAGLRERLSEMVAPRQRLQPGRLWSVGRGYPAAASSYLVVALVLGRLQAVAAPADLGARRQPLAVGPFHSIGRIAWDSGNFLKIARDGYGSEDHLAASFPGYPLLIQLVHRITGINHETAAVVVSTVAGLGAALLFWTWLRTKGVPTSAAVVALWLLLLFPYSFPLYGIAYADGVLLCCVLSCVVLAERDRWWWAGLAGAAATYARPNGLVVIPMLAAMVLDRSGALRGADLRPSRLRAWWSSGGERRPAVRRRLAKLRVAHLGALLCLLGIGTYMWQMERLHSDALYFWTSQVDDYGHRAFSSLDTWLKVEFVNRPGEFVSNGPDGWNQLVCGILVVLALWAVPSAIRRLGLAYGVLVAGSVAVLWVTATGFAPAGRYLLPAWPFVFAVIAPWLACRPQVRRPLYAVAAVGLGALVVAFARVSVLNW